MTLTLQIINAVLILTNALLSIKHGWAMLTAQPKMLDMFQKWDIGRTGVIIFGAFGIASALLTLFPKTFFTGNFLNAGCLLLLVALCLHQKDVKGALIELPFFLLPLLIVYLGHPLAK